MQSPEGMTTAVPKSIQEGAPSLVEAQPVTVVEATAFTPPPQRTEAVPRVLTSVIRLNMAAHTATLALLGFINWATWAAFLLVVVSGSSVLTGCCRSAPRYTTSQQLRVLLVSSCC